MVEQNQEQVREIIHTFDIIWLFLALTLSLTQTHALNAAASYISIRKSIES